MEKSELERLNKLSTARYRLDGMLQDLEQAKELIDYFHKKMFQPKQIKQTINILWDRKIDIQNRIETLKNEFNCL